MTGRIARTGTAAAPGAPAVAALGGSRSPARAMQTRHQFEQCSWSNQRVALFHVTCHVSHVSICAAHASAACSSGSPAFAGNSGRC
eukprot:1993354-Alexandrium_andersonii.AAC.1